MKSARPGNLPIERSAKLRHVVNPKAAQAIGTTILPSLLQHANEVIR